MGTPKDIFLLLVVLFCSQNAFAYGEVGLTHVQSFEGKVGSGNFTYYSLNLAGHVIIRLESLFGDADLYGSASTLQPTYENYEFKSVTCGTDEIHIEPRLKRPVGIGVYGYISEDINHFKLSVYINTHYVNPYLEEGSNVDRDGAAESPVKTRLPLHDEREEESILWTIFVGFLKILFDVLI